MTFRVGDRIAHPMHGAGVIDSVVTRKINGKERDYYVLKLPVGDMLVMIPVDTSAAIGVRPIVGADEAEKILGSIPGPGDRDDPELEQALPGKHAQDKKREPSRGGRSRKGAYEEG